MQTGHGTSNLIKDIDACLQAQGILVPKAALSADYVPYSEDAHCALIALQCAKSSHPINSVLDEDYLREVQMLHPGTKVPGPMTVQRDLSNIYEQMSIHVRNYFMVWNIFLVSP